jgi:hypothetical protein
VSATVYQLNADFLFESSDLPTERWLGSVKLLLRGNGQTACISDSNEVAEMPKLHHTLPCLAGMGLAYKVFFERTSALYNQKARHAGSAWQAERIAAAIRPARHGDGLVMR